MKQGPCPPDDGSELERVRYFSGQLLTPSDLEQEQAYLLAKARRHSRLLHGWGVVTGLDVSIATDPHQVVVSPGLALDPCGREVVVPEGVTVHLSSTAKGFVAVRYDETEVRPIPVPGHAEPQAGRVRESFEASLLAEPADGWIVLGAFTQSAESGLQLDSSPRRPVRLDSD